MSIVDVEFRLPDDVDAAPEADGQEFLVTRRGSRIPPQVLSADAWTLLQRFRVPSTLSAAIIGYCREHGGEPFTTLDEAFPVLVALTRSGLLVANGTDAALSLTPRFSRDERVGPATLVAPIRVLRDGELWTAVSDDGSPVAVKVVDEAISGPEFFLRETTALRRLVGGPVPDLVRELPRSTGGVLVLSFVEGDPVDLAALDERGCRHPLRALELVLTTLDAYAAIHALGVLHGDVHPGNVLVDEQGRVTLIDFGIADVSGSGLAPAPRAAGGEQLDPQAAAALLHGESLPVLDVAAEVYALATLAYRVITGSPPLDLELVRKEALDAITTRPPRMFVEVGQPSWPAIEAVLARGLAKDPTLRPTGAREFRDALAAAADHTPLETSAKASGSLLDEVDVDGILWATADAATAADTAADLRALASATGDVDAHDLAVLWGVRACAH